MSHMARPGSLKMNQLTASLNAESTVAATDTARCRGPRLLWANLYCLLNSSSGASMSVRQMLCSLVAQGYEVQILGATVFDHPHGIGALTQRFDTAKVRPGNCVEVRDGPLVHKLYSTATTSRGQLTEHDESGWFWHYQQALDQFKPTWFSTMVADPLTF